MPFYYSVALLGLSTNGTANTDTDHLRSLTVAASSCGFVEIYGAARNSGAGGMRLSVNRYGTASTAGSAATPAPRNTRQPAANTTFFSGPTVGTTATTQMVIGMSQLGGMNGWVAPEPDAAIYLQSGGGANGNLDLLSNAVGVSQAFDLTVGITEQ